MTCILNDGKLHTKAEAKERYIIFTCVFNSCDLSVDSTVTESTRNKNSLYITKHFCYVVLVQFLRINPFDIYSSMLEDSTMF